jgi:predicted nucleic acid-binding protein
LEVANALTVLARRGNGERQAALGWLRALPLRLDHEAARVVFSLLSSLAAKYQLSVYDAA